MDIPGTDEQGAVKLSTALSSLRFEPLRPDAPAVNSQPWLQCEVSPCPSLISPEEMGATSLEIDEDTLTLVMGHSTLPSVTTWATSP